MFLSFLVDFRTTRLYDYKYKLTYKFMEELTDEIYELVKKKMSEQGAYDRDSYRLLIDETIVYFHEKGKLTDNDNEKFIIDQLMQRWEFAKEDLSY